MCLRFGWEKNLIRLPSVNTDREYIDCCHMYLIVVQREKKIGVCGNGLTSWLKVKIASEVY